MAPFFDTSRTSFETFKHYIQNTPSPYHSSSYIQKTLKEAGFEALDEKKPWDLKPGSKLIITRGCTTTAIILPKKTPKKLKIIASHLDTPALTLRPSPVFFDGGLAFFRTEVYGGPHLYSLMNRPLDLAGAAFFSSSHPPTLFKVSSQHFFLPTCPIHLEKKTNVEPPPIERHRQLSVMVGDIPAGMDEKGYFDAFCQKLLGKEHPLSIDAYFTAAATPTIIDSDGHKMASPRIDNGASVVASLEAIKVARAYEQTGQICAFFHHEEIGSASDQGAESELLSALITRLLSGLGLNFDSQQAVRYSSSIISLDNAHAFWPLDKDKYDYPNSPLLGRGPALKKASSMRYATSPQMVALIQEIATKNGIPLQYSVPHSNFPAGSTLGPLLAKTCGIPTIDIGLAQLSMHGAEEVMDLRDLQSLTHLIQSYLASKE